MRGMWREESISGGVEGKEGKEEVRVLVGEVCQSQGHKSFQFYITSLKKRVLFGFGVSPLFFFGFVFCWSVKQTI